MLAVIMGAPTFKIRNRDASMLLNYGFSKFYSKKIIEKDAEVEKVVLDKKGEKFFMAKAAENLSVTLEKGKEDNIEKKLELDTTKNKYAEGEIIGTCEFFKDNKSIGKIKVYCDREVKRGNFIDNIKYNIKNLFKGSI